MQQSYLMAMNYLNLFADYNLSEKSKKAVERREGILVHERAER